MYYTVEAQCQKTAIGLLGSKETPENLAILDFLSDSASEAVLKQVWAP